MIEINPLNQKKVLNDLTFDIVALSDGKAFRELEKEIEDKHFCFKDKRRLK